MNAYVEFFLNGPRRVVELETLRISHVSFSREYWIVRNNYQGLTAKLENGQEQFFEYYPAKIVKTSTENTLDQVFKISLGDLGEILPDELDRVLAAGTYNIHPQVQYRVYRSDNLDAPLLGPMDLEIVDLPFNAEGVAFEAKAPTLNQNQTGAIYDLNTFPGLRGML